MKFKKKLGMLTVGLLVITLNQFQPDGDSTMKEKKMVTTPVARAETVKLNVSEDDEVLFDYQGEQLSEFETYVYNVKNKFLNNENVLSEGKKPKFYQEHGIEFECASTEFGIFCPNISSNKMNEATPEDIAMYAVVLEGKCTNLKNDFEYYEAYMYLFDKKEGVICQGRLRSADKKYVINDLYWNTTFIDWHEDGFYCFDKTCWIMTDDGELKYIKNKSKIINVGKVKESKYNIRLNMEYFDLNKYKKKNKAVYNFLMNNIGYSDFNDSVFLKRYYYGQEKTKNGYKITIIDALKNKKLSFVTKTPQKIWNNILSTDDGSEYHVWGESLKNSFYIANDENCTKVNKKEIKTYKICGFLTYKEMLVDKYKWKTQQDICGTEVINGKIYFVVEQWKERYVGDDWENKNSIYVLKNIDGKTIIKAKTWSGLNKKIKKLKK